MSIDKKDPTREGSEDSMDLNSPTPEAETGAPQENVGQQKRKGGRKPVRFVLHYYPAKRVQKLICDTDLCYLGRTKTTQSSSSGGI
jgi:hypothetical protein